MMVWTVHFRAFATSLAVSVNPLGAYRIDASRLPGKPKDPVLASASIGKNEWSAEVAIPIIDIESIGFISAAASSCAPSRCTGTSLELAGRESPPCISARVRRSGASASGHCSERVLVRRPRRRLSNPANPSSM